MAQKHKSECIKRKEESPRRAQAYEKSRKCVYDAAQDSYPALLGRIRLPIPGKREASNPKYENRDNEINFRLFAFPSINVCHTRILDENIELLRNKK